MRNNNIIFTHNIRMENNKKTYKYSPPWKREQFTRKLTTENGAKYITPNQQIQRYEKQNRPRAKSLNE